MSSTWTELRITAPIRPEDIQGLIDLVNTLGSGLETALEVTKTLLEASKLYLLTTIDPLAALVAQLAEELDDVVGGLQEAGVGIAFLPVEYGNLKTVESQYTTLAQSVTDRFDFERPIVTDITADITMINIVMREPTYELLVKLWNDLMDLLFDYSKFNVPESLKEFGKEPENLYVGDSLAPDWSSQTLSDAIPALGSALDTLRDLTLLLVDATTIQTDLIDSLIEIIDSKIAEINNILLQLENVVELITTLELFASSGVLVNVIEGAFSQLELQSAIIQAVDDIPNPDPNSYAAVVSMYTLTPAVGDVLKSFFT